MQDGTTGGIQTVTQGRKTEVYFYFVCFIMIHIQLMCVSMIFYLWRHAAEINRKQNDIENLKELLYTYEKTMDHKDNIIANMTKAIQKQVIWCFKHDYLKIWVGWGWGVEKKCDNYRTVSIRHAKDANKNSDNLPVLKSLNHFPNHPFVMGYVTEKYVVVLLMLVRGFQPC